MYPQPYRTRYSMTRQPRLQKRTAIHGPGPGLGEEGTSTFTAILLAGGLALFLAAPTLYAWHRKITPTQTLYR
jgi:hypothetical protein